MYNDRWEHVKSHRKKCVQATSLKASLKAIAATLLGDWEDERAAIEASLLEEFEEACVEAIYHESLNCFKVYRVFKGTRHH